MKNIDMKNIFTIAALTVASVIAVSCAKEVAGNSGLIAHASLQPFEATKAIGQYSYNIVWEENDHISVLDASGLKGDFELINGQGTTSGTFRYGGEKTFTAPLSAFYPASIVTEDKSLVWPSEQSDVKNIANVPMTATSPKAEGDINFAFKHLGAVLQLVFTAKNGEIKVGCIDITADQGLSGEFEVVEGTAKILASESEGTITTGDISGKGIKISAAATYLNFAVPAGNFTNFKITITDISGKQYSLSAKDLTLERATVNKLTFALYAQDLTYNEFKISGHTVRVQRPADILDAGLTYSAFVDNDALIITAAAADKGTIICRRDDDKIFTEHLSDGFYNFVLSDFKKDVTVSLDLWRPYVVFNDPGFEAFCLERYDEDKDGKVSREEAGKVTDMDFGTNSFASISGVGDFPSLSRLDFGTGTVPPALNLTGNEALKTIDMGESGCGQLYDFNYVDVTKPEVTTRLSIGQVLKVNGVEAVVCIVGDDDISGTTKVLATQSDSTLWWSGSHVDCKAKDKDGMVNTEKILASEKDDEKIACAARYARHFGPMWYLPSLFEFEIFYKDEEKNKVVFSKISGLNLDHWAWTSTESDISHAYYISIENPDEGWIKQKNSNVLSVIAMKKL